MARSKPASSKPVLKPLLIAIRLIGTRKIVCHLLEITVQRLDNWLNKEVEMPYEYALTLEFLTKQQVSAETLSPKKARLFKRLGIQVHLSQAAPQKVKDIEQFLQEKPHGDETFRKDKKDPQASKN